MINVQERALRALEQDVIAAPQRLVQQNHGVRDERLQVIACGAVFRMDLLERQRLGAEGLQDLVVLLDLGLELRLEALRVDQINHAQARPRRLVAVSRADAAFGGADLVLALEGLALGIEFAMIGKDQVRRLAEEEVAVNPDAELAQPLDFLDEAHGVNHHAVADDADLVLAQNAGGDQVQDVFLPFDVDRVAGVVAALRADHHVRLLGQHVNDLAFAFIAPLGAD